MITYQIFLKVAWDYFKPLKMPRATQSEKAVCLPFILEVLKKETSTPFAPNIASVAWGYYKKSLHE